MVENGVSVTANRNMMWIQERLRSERARWLSWVCCPTQNMPRVRKVIMYITSRGESATKARRSSCSLWTASVAGTRRSSTSSVMATAKTPSLRAARRSTLWPAIRLYEVVTAIEFSRAWSRRKNGKVLVSPAVPTRTKTLHKGISVFKEQSQARALGQPVLFQRLKATRELSAPPVPGSPSPRVSSTRHGGFRSAVGLMRARAQRATKRGFPSHLLPTGTTVKTGPKNKKSRNRRLAFSDSTKYIIAYCGWFCLVSCQLYFHTVFSILDQFQHLCGA